MFCGVERMKIKYLYRCPVCKEYFENNVKAEFHAYSKRHYGNYNLPSIIKFLKKDRGEQK